MIWYTSRGLWRFFVGEQCHIFRYRDIIWAVLVKVMQLLQGSDEIQLLVTDCMLFSSIFPALQRGFDED